MVKYIPTKRNTKKLNVDEYWELRQKMRPREKEKTKKRAQTDISRRYKFKNMKQELKSINVGISYFIEEIKTQPYSSTEDNLGSFFQDELEQQHAKCKFQYYKEFYNKIEPYSQNLPLILHNINYILDCIISNIQDLDADQDEESQKKNQLMTPHMLDLLQELIRDCQQFVFKIFIDKIFIRITNLLTLQDLNLLQKIYKVLAYALKYFFAEIQDEKNFTIFLELYIKQLFEHKNRAIRQFSSESFSYVIKKLTIAQREKYIPLIFEKIKDIQYSKQTSHLFDSISHTLFSALTSVQKFITYKGMDYYKEFLQIFFSNKLSQENNANVVLSLFLENCFKNFTFQEQEEKLCFNVNEMIFVLSNLLQSSLTKTETLVQIICEKIISFLDIVPLNDKNVNSIVNITKIAVLNTPKIENISKLISKLFVKGMENFQKEILIDEIVDFILEKFDIKQTWEFINMLLPSYEKKKEDIERAFTFQQNIYNYLIVLAFQNFNKALESDQQYYLSVIFLALFIHQKTFQYKQLNFKKEFFSQGVLNNKGFLLNLYQNYIQKGSILDFQKLFLVVKILQFSNDVCQGHLQEEIIQIYKLMNDKFNIDESYIQDLPKDSFLENFYEINEKIQRKYELKSKEIAKKFKFELLKSEILQLLALKEIKITPQEERKEIIFAQKQMHNPLYLQNFAFYIEKQKSKLRIEENKDFYEALCGNLKSKYTEIRLCSLQILNQFSFENKEDEEVLQTLLYIQSLRVTLENERQIKIDLIKFKTFSHKYSKDITFAIFNFLLGYLFVRFSLLWPTIADVLQHLMNQDSQKELLQRVFINQLAYYNFSMYQQYLNENNTQEVQENQGEEEIKEGNFFELFDDFYVFEGDCIEEKIVFQQLFNSLNQVKKENLNEQTKSQIIKLTEEFLRKEHKSIDFQLQNKENLQELEIVQLSMQSQLKINNFLYCKYECYMKTFIQFISVKDLKNNNREYFYQTFLVLLRKKKLILQQLALDCILKYEQPQLHKYAKSLQVLVKKDGLRKELLTFKTVEENHRKVLIPIIMGIVYPHLFTKKGSEKKSKKHGELQRNSLFQFFGSLEENEMGNLIQFVFQNFHIPIYSNQTIVLQNEKELINVHLNQIEEFNINIKNIIGKLGTFVLPFIKQILNYILSLLSACQKIKQQIKNDENIENNQKNSQIKKRIKTLQKQVLERYCEICRQNGNIEEMKDFVKLFLQIMNEKILNLKDFTVTSLPFILKVFQTWSEEPSFIYIFEENTYIFEILMSLYSREKINVKIIQILHKVFFNILNINSEESPNHFFKSYYVQFLDSIYHYLEYNLAPSSLIKKNKQKKIDSDCLSIIYFLSSNIQEQKDFSLYLNYFVKFLDAANIKKLKDINEDKQETSQENEERQYNYKNKNASKMESFIQILKIVLNLLNLNLQNQTYYECLINILPNANTPDLKKLTIQCIIALKSNFIEESMIKILQNMSTYQRSVQQQLNYDLLIDTIYEVNTKHMRNWIQNPQYINNLEIYVMNLLSLISDNEMSVKLALNSSFTAFFEIIQEEGIVNENNVEHLQKILLKKIIPFIGKELKKNREEFTLKSLLQILKMYIKYSMKNPQVANLYNDLQVLIHTDDNQDFFECITHIQINRRIKAVNNFLSKNLVNMEQTTLWTFIVPIIEYNILFKCQDVYRKSNKMKLTDQLMELNKGLLQASINVLGSISGILSVAKTKKLLKKYVQFLSNKGFEQKITIKVLVSITENLKLPYNIVEEVNKQMNEINTQQNEKTLLAELIEKNKQFVNPNKDFEDQDNQQNQQNQAINEEDNWVGNLQREKFLLKNIENQMEIEQEIPSEMQSYYNFLRLQVFLPIKQLLFDHQNEVYNKLAKQNLEEKTKNKQDEKVRIFMTIGLVKLLIRFPKEIFSVEFPKVISKVVKNLKTKDNDERDFTRKVLLQIINITGPYFLHYIIKELKYFLNKGWENHILNFTVYTLISQIDTFGPPIGCLDYCHNDIFPLLIDEIFGSLNEEKNLQFTKIPEQKKNKANDTFQLFAKWCDFRNVVSFISFLRTQLIQYLDGAKNQGKFEHLFNFILEGFAKNKSMKHELLIPLSYTLIRDALDLIEQTKVKDKLLDTTIKEEQEIKDKKVFNLAKKYEIMETTAQNKSIFKHIQDEKKRSDVRIGYTLSNFGLKLCIIGVKSNIFAPQVIENEQQFQQLLKMIVECLKSTDNNMIITSLKILRNVLSRKESKNIRKSTVQAVLTIMGKLSNTDIEMINETFKIMTEIIENFSNILKNSQFKAILQYIKQLIDVSDNCPAPLNLLKTIIDKKRVFPEVYDLIDEKIREMMIQSYAQNIQNVCKSIFLSFLVNYPISDKLMQNEINFLIKNTEYNYDQGKLIVFDVLLTIIKSFPDNIISFFGEILFVSYLVNLIKEQSIQNIIYQHLEALNSRLSEQQIEHLIQNCSQWVHQQENPKIQESGFCGLKIFLKKENEKFFQKKEFFTNIQKCIIQIFDTREERMNIFWEIIKQKKEKKEIMKKNAELQELLIDEEGLEEQNQQEAELKNDSLLNNVIEFLQNYVTFIKESGNNNIIFEGEKLIICSLLQFVNFPNQNTSNLAINCIISACENNQQLAQNIFLKKKQTIENLLPKLIKYLYFSKLKNNTVIQNTSNSHNFFFFAFEFFYSQKQQLLINTLFEQLLKIFLKSYAKAYYNKAQIENIVELIHFFAQKLQQKDELKEFFCNNERLVDIIIEIIIKVKTQDVNNKITNNEILEKAELTIEELKKTIELNKFFSIYQKIKSKIENIKQERKEQKKTEFITNPQEAQMKKIEQNLKKRKANQIKQKNKKLPLTQTKKILKKE